MRKVKTRSVISPTILAAMIIPLVVSGCDSADRSDPLSTMSKQDLEQYCGLNKESLLKDMQDADSRVQDLEIMGAECKTRVHYTNEDGWKKTTN